MGKLQPHTFTCVLYTSYNTQQWILQRSSSRKPVQRSMFLRYASFTFSKECAEQKPICTYMYACRGQFQCPRTIHVGLCSFVFEVNRDCDGSNTFRQQNTVCYDCPYGRFKDFVRQNSCGDRGAPESHRMLLARPCVESQVA